MFLQRSQNKEDELQAEKGQIFHYFQNLLTNTSLAELSLLFSLQLDLYQIFIYGTYNLF